MYHAIVDQNGAATNRMAGRSIGLRAEMKNFGNLRIRPIFGGIWITNKDAGVLMAGCTTSLCLSASDGNE